MCQDFWSADVGAVHKIGAKDRAVEFISFTFGFRPLAEFLGEPAVVGVLALPQRQPQFGGDLLQTGGRLCVIDLVAGIDPFQGDALGRDFRMERKGLPIDVDMKISLQLFNTPGNEVAPGSDIVGKYHEASGHRLTPSLSGPDIGPTALFYQISQGSAAVILTRRRIESGP